MRSRRRRVLAVVVSLLALAGAACGGDDDDGDGSILAGAGEGGGDDGLATIAGSLAALPAAESQDPTQIAWGDLARAAEIAGVTPPDDPADEEAVRTYLQGVLGNVRGSGDPVAYAVPPEASNHMNPDVTAFADEVGWSILDIERFVERQTPPAYVTVMEGGFDESRLSDALGEAEDGTWRAGEGDAYEMSPQEASPARRFGEALWFTLPDGRLTVTRSPDDSAAVTQALTGGDAPTLADDPALAGVATALDEESAYAAMLLAGGGDGAGPAGAGAPPEARQAACAQALPQPTAAVGTGVADEDGPVILIALAHESADAAQANAEALERLVTEGHSVQTNQPWSELVSLDAVGTTGDGLVTVARLRPTDPTRAQLWYQLLFNRDALVTSC
ncbi:MAG TPA: hypothetical protein VIL48_16185 [Acidimicrobiales bacterium]